MIAAARKDLLFPLKGLDKVMPDRQSDRGTEKGAEKSIAGARPDPRDDIGLSTLEVFQVRIIGVTFVYIYPYVVLTLFD